MFHYFVLEPSIDYSCDYNNNNKHHNHHYLIAVRDRDCSVNSCDDYLRCSQPIGQNVPGRLLLLFGVFFPFQNIAMIILFIQLALVVSIVVTIAMVLLTFYCYPSPDGKYI